MDETWSLAKGIHDLGIGFFAHLQVKKKEPSNIYTTTSYKQRKRGLGFGGVAIYLFVYSFLQKDCLAMLRFHFQFDHRVSGMLTFCFDAQHDKSALEPSMAADSRDKSRSSESAGVQESIATARKSLHKALDCQLFIVSLFTKGMLFATLLS